jgi:hypothetical protein
MKLKMLVSKKKWNWPTSQTVQGNIYAHGANLLLAKHNVQFKSIFPSQSA